MRIPAAIEIEEAVRTLVGRALVEDLGELGDVTSAVAVPEGAHGSALLVAKDAGVVAGLDHAVCAFRTLDPAVEIDAFAGDGDAVAAGERVLAITGDARALLAAERTALNFLQRLSGIATVTRRVVGAVAGTGVLVLDTRKTTPLLRAAEKRAVRLGGGVNHRHGLFDQILLKENHFAFARPLAYADVVRRAAAVATAPVIAEARTVDEARAAVQGGAAVVLLDNFAVGAPLRAAVAAVRAEAEALGRAVEVEASGGVTLDNARAVAECGVDRISIGALTHSAPALDFSLLVEVEG